MRSNDIRGNDLVGVYLFNNAVRNPIEGNTISSRFGDRRSQYGVFLFNSAGNVFQVARSGRNRNRMTGALIANFREFTGPVEKTLVPLPQLPGQLPESIVGPGRSGGDDVPGDRGGRNGGRRARTGPRRPLGPRQRVIGVRSLPKGPDRLLRRRG